MQSLNRTQNRPRFRTTPQLDAPKPVEQLEDRVLFSAGETVLATNPNPAHATQTAIVYEMHPAGASANATGLAPALPSLRELGNGHPQATSFSFAAASVAVPNFLEIPASEDYLVGRHVKSPWSTTVDQPAGLHAKVKREAVASVARDIGPLPPSGKGLVLLVEDDAASRNALSTILRRRGWRVETAATLSEGMRLLDTHPDRVIVDLMLPDGDGGKIVQRLSAEGESGRVTVMTGVSDPARLAQVKAMHPGAVLQKPVSVSALLHDLAADIHSFAA